MNKIVVSIFLVWGWVATGFAGERDEAPDKEPARNETASMATDVPNDNSPMVESAAKTAPPQISFQPRTRGAPVIRIGGGSRGALVYVPATQADSSTTGSGTKPSEFKPKPSGAPLTRIGGGSRQGFIPAVGGGAPKRRVGGGTREGELISGFSLTVLAPEETGLTVEAQPTLYWYLSHDIDEPVEFTIIDASSIEAGVKPLLELRMEPPVSAGFHAVDLAKFEISLKDEIDYQWFVSIVHDELQRSRDTLSGAQIRKVPVEKGLQAALSANGTFEAGAYAERGIWYEAIDRLETDIRTKPGSTARTQKAELLQQVGLSAAADAVDMVSAPD